MYEYRLIVEQQEYPLSRIGVKVDKGKLDIGTETRLASGALVRDLVAVKRSWTFSWEKLPGETSLVEDGGLGRDDLAILAEAGDTLTLMEPAADGSYTHYVVVFAMDSWQENRVRVQPHFVWDVSFTLVEV